MCRTAQVQHAFIVYRKAVDGAEVTNCSLLKREGVQTYEGSV
jgi:hypothetical protein